MAQQKPGTVGWLDLTVNDASSVRDFYSAVAGWTSSPVNMGDYEDFCMLPPGASEPVAGICNARGANQGLPPMWLPYIIVTDLDASIAACNQRGGKVIHGPKSFGPQARYCVITDPAGAAAALFQPGDEQPS